MTLATYPLASPQSLPFQITSGPGGDLWFTENRVITVGGKSTAVGAIGSINPTTKAITEYNIPNPGASPRGIVWGPDGDVWFTDLLGNAIGRLDPSNHAIVEYPVPTANSGPTGIAVGSDGNLWFTEFNTGQVGKISPTTHAIVEYPLGTTTSQPSGITVGPDGDLWFVEKGAGAIGQIDPTTHAVGEFKIPSGLGFPDAIGAIGAASDGKMYFGVTEVAGFHWIAGFLGSIDPTTHAFESYPAEASGGFAQGPDGKLYFTSNQQIGTFDLATHALDYSPQILNAKPGTSTYGITLGPDGSFWFADGGLIGRATIIPADQAVIVGGLGVTTGSTQIVTVGRTVYVDLNGDGTFDPGDPSAVTDADGQFTIGAVPSGHYTLRLVTFPGDVATALPLTLTGGQLVSGNILLQPTAAILPLTYSLTPFGPSNPDVTTAEVTALYNIVIGRAPDVTGLAFWVGAIKGGVPYAQVAADFLHSAAYYDRVVAADYQTFAGRAPAPAESATWVGLLQKGYTEEQVAYLMLTSPGFTAAHADNGSFVQALYNDLLGRRASATEVSAWGAFLAGGASRGYVTSLFLDSQGAAQRAVDGLYAIVLGRPADAAGEAFDADALENGIPLADVAWAFLTTPEFIRRANATVHG